MRDILATIELARRAAHEINNALVNAESWVTEVEGGAGVGHLITARAQVEAAQAHALRSVGLCSEAAAELRHFANESTRRLDKELG